MFCTEMDGIDSLNEVVIILASNRADLIDPAILRPGRIDRKIKIDRPNREGAREIYRIYLTDDLPYDSELLKDAESTSAAIDRLIGRLTDAQFARREENRLLEIILRSGRKEVLYRSDVISGAKPTRTPRFVKNAGGTPALDEKALARARKLAGLKGYVTNIPAYVMPPAEVISCYHDLWHVEQSFRMSKTDLAARPMFARKRDAIEAHLTIVFTALAVAREAQDRTGLAIRNVIRQLRPLRSATIAVNGAVQAFPPAIYPEQQKILDDLKNGRDLRH
jgi:hypothetical protein